MTSSRYFYTLFNRNIGKHRKSFPVAVGHLINVVEKAEWFKPPQVQ